MKRAGFVLWLLLVVSEVGAQTIIKRYYDKEGFQTDSARSYYFEIRVLSDDADPPIITYYTESNKVRFKEGFKDEQGDKLRTYYYQNGVIKAEGLFSTAGPKGLVNTFYDNGKKQAELFFEEKKEIDVKDQVIGIIEYWDSLGNPLVDHGKGFCRCNLNPFSDQQLIENGLVIDGLQDGEWTGQGGMDENQYSFKESYSKGNLIQGVQQRGDKSFTYDRLQKNANPPGGMKAFYTNISEILRYPQSARKRNIQGVVYVEFVIDEEGNLKDVKIVKGIDKVCDDEALRAVNASPKWSPGYVRGKPVKKRLTLPIVFKLRI